MAHTQSDIAKAMGDANLSNDSVDYKGYGGSVVTGEPEKTANHVSSAFGGEGKHPNIENPQFLLELPEGYHNLNMKVRRTDLNKKDALIMILYKAQTEGSGRWYIEPPEDQIVSKSSYRRQFDATVAAGIEGGPDNKYILYCATDNAEATGPIVVTVNSDGCFPQLTSLGAKCFDVESTWGEGKDGGYCKPDNPQYLFEVENEELVFIQLRRTDEAKDMGMVFFVFSYEGDDGARIGVTNKADAVYTSSFKASTEVNIKETFAPGKYMILPCLQRAGGAGPFSLSLKSENFEPTVSELTGGAVAASARPAASAGAATAAAAAAPAAPDEDVVAVVIENETVVHGSWRGDKAAGYKKVGNPQFLMSLPHGEHNVRITCTRKCDDSGGEGLVLFVYKYAGAGARMTRITAAGLTGQTPYKIGLEVEETITLIGGPNKYMLLPCLKTPGAEGDFNISCVGDISKPLISTLGSREHNSQMMSATWTPELSGGYMKAANPMFMLELPEGEHPVDFTLKRSDMKKDQGLSCLVYVHESGDKLPSSDEELKANYTLAAKSEMKISDKVTLSSTLAGYPKTLLIMCCLQKADSEGALSLNVETGDCLPMLCNLRERDAIPDELQADIGRVAAAAKPKKMKAVAPPPED